MKKPISMTITILTMMSITFLGHCNIDENPSSSTEDPSALERAQIEETLSVFMPDSLSETEVNGLVWMREEEKLARDVYIHFYETWGLRIFNNISLSESTHMYAIKILLDRYEIEDPVAEDVVGIFESSALSDLYSILINRGDSSLVQALLVGATIEDLDIFDLGENTDAADNEDILFAYDNLTKGSRNHIRSFTAKLDQYGEDYQAQYISEALLDSILSSPKEIGHW